MNTLGKCQVDKAGQRRRDGLREEMEVDSFLDKQIKKM